MQNEIRLIPPTHAAITITRRTVLALGLVSLRPSAGMPDQPFDGMQVLGYMRVDEETKCVPLAVAEERP